MVCLSYGARWKRNALSAKISYPHVLVKDSAVIHSLREYLGLHLCRIVSRPLGCEPAPTGSIRYELMLERDLLPHCADPGLELPEDQARSALARGDLCVAAFEGERLVGYEWFAFGPTPHLPGLWVAFDRDARYGYKKFVHPDYRGKRIAAGLSAYGDQWCLRRGCTRTVAFIDMDNHASWRASARLGSTTVGYAGYVKLFNAYLCFRSPGAKALGFRFYAPAKAAVRTRPLSVPAV